MEPSTNFCYANDATAVTAMHTHASVYPSASMDPYTGHYIAASYPGAPNAQYCSVDAAYQVANISASNSGGYSMIQYIPPLTTTSSPAPSPGDGSCLSNPLTPPHDDSLIRQSPSGSPSSVQHETNFQTIPLQTIQGSIHLPGTVII